MAEQLLKVWNNWSDGLGWAVDDGSHNGLYGPLDVVTGSPPSIIALPNELRPGKASIDTEVDVVAPILDSFTVPGGSYVNLYLICSISGGGAAINLHKIKVAGTTFTDRNGLGYAAYLGKAAPYKGNWYFSELSAGATIRKLTTSVDGVIASDTITAGDASSGNGHLDIIGHQLAKLQPALGVSLLATDADATANANWGSPFPVLRGLKVRLNFPRAPTELSPPKSFGGKISAQNWTKLARSPRSNRLGPAHVLDTIL